jgi:hypothetical protein
LLSELFVFLHQESDNVLKSCQALLLAQIVFGIYGIIPEQVGIDLVEVHNLPPQGE